MRIKQAARGDKIDGMYEYICTLGNTFRYLSAIMLDFLDKTIELAQVFPATVLLWVRCGDGDGDGPMLLFRFICIPRQFVIGIRYKMVAVTVSRFRRARDYTPF